VVGFCLTRLEGRVLRIEDLMLSCRVQGKQIERALLYHLTNNNGHTLDAVEIAFHQTKRNGPASAVLDDLGFEPTTNEVRRITMTPGIFDTDIVTIENCQPGPTGDLP
jgi:predicted enzyme involved in methoxymalonyl-ACP biosynthesis